MKIQRKYDPFKVCIKPCQLTFQEYSGKIGRYTNKQIRKLFKLVFGKECTINEVWAKYLIQYELARQQCVVRGAVAQLEKGSQFRNAYMAVRRMDLSKVNENLKTLIVYELKHNNNEMSKETLMKKQEAIKTAAEVKKSKCIGVTTGLSVYDAWVYIFKKNATAHEPDEKITEFMLSEFPDHQIKSFHQVHAVRINYNNGRYTKGVKPEVKSVRYLADGSEWKRGHKAVEPKKVEAVKPSKIKKAKKTAK